MAEYGSVDAPADRLLTDKAAYRWADHYGKVGTRPRSTTGSARARPTAAAGPARPTPNPTCLPRLLFVSIGYASHKVSQEARTALGHALADHRGFFTGDTPVGNQRHRDIGW